MRAILPGRPESRLQAVGTGFWDSRQITAYISGSAFSILTGPQTLCQTVYDDDESPLVAIALDEASGKIAACTATVVRVYRPFGQEEDALKWALQTSFEIPDRCDDDDSPVPSLSWGSSEELLVGTTSLNLFATSNEAEREWHKTLPNPAALARLSYDSAYIASVGRYDRLVKVWRRLSYDASQVRFDFSYLRHPHVVVNLRWRQPYHVGQSADNVLYTFCADNVLRVWTASDSHGSQPLHLWGQVDLASPPLAATPPHREASSYTRWAFVMDGRDFSAATEKAVATRDGADVALGRLVAVANMSPEVCVAFDSSGLLSAWALENVGCKSSAAPNIFSIAHVKSNDFDFLQHTSRNPDSRVELHCYCDKPSGLLHLLVHFFDGRVEVYTAGIADLFDPTATGKRLELTCAWSGHSASIQKIVRNFSGRAVVSRTGEGESVVWTHHLFSEAPRLSRQSVIPEGGHIHRICVLRKGRFVVFLRHETISLWDCRQARALLLARQAYALSGKPLCLVILPRQRVNEYARAHIATVTSERQGMVWEVNLPQYASQSPAATANGHGEASIREFCRFSLQEAEGLAYVLPVDPAGSAPIVDGFLDVFARDVAISYTHSGQLGFWTARVEQESRQVGWLLTSSVETGIAEPALVSGSTLKKAALVNSTRSQVTIWDVGGARLEYARDFHTHNAIQDLDWTSTPDSQSILAVGFQYRVILLSQMRFDYLNKGPAWAPIREISIRELTPHPIGDSTWLGDGHLVIGAGNQLFVYDRSVDLVNTQVGSFRLPHKKDGTADLFNVVQRFNGPLPVFHPQFLSQCILVGKTALVRRIMSSMHKALKYLVEGETLDDYLDLNLDEFYAGMGAANQTSATSLGSRFVRRSSVEDNDEPFSEEVALLMSEKLTKITLPQLSGHEQIQLADIIECLGLVEKHRRSMDENAARFMLFFRQHALRKGRTNEIQMSWREINWAYHSTSQDILVDFVTKQYHGTVLWEHARESGMFMWLSDLNALRQQFEIIARNEYTKSEMKNPVDCSLFYLALKKKAVLQGLWRMASWNKEQAATQRLLANNFDDPKWRTAALKNAYALLSKRRFKYAAAFFLLADRLQDAVNVCMNQLKDLQLAVTIARVYEGDSGPVLRKLLEDEVLAVASQDGNRWLASWAFWMLHRRDMAVRALITPVYTLLETPCSPDIRSRLFLTDDPSLVVLYSQLRQMTLQTLRGASKVTPRVEWEFVLHSAKLYDRMGCDLLGLDLVRNWEFLRPSANLVPGFGGEINPLKLLAKTRRSSLVVADLPVASLSLGMKAGGGGKQQPPPTTFEEPDSNSLLDSFGF